MGEGITFFGASVVSDPGNPWCWYKQSEYRRFVSFIKDIVPVLYVIHIGSTELVKWVDSKGTYTWSRYFIYLNNNFMLFCLLGLSVTTLNLFKIFLTKLIMLKAKNLLR